MLARDHGHIVNIASMAGKMTVPGVATYNATKFGVVALSRSVRAEIAHTHVTISTVMPAAVRTELTAGITTRGIPTVEPSQVAKAIIDSARNPHREIAVPRWAALLGPVEQLLPEPALAQLRRLAGGNRLLNDVDHTQRQTYTTRMNQPPH